MSGRCSAMPRSSDSGRMGARYVNERDDRQAEPLGELHDPHRLAVALRDAASRSSPDVLLGVGALLLADDAIRRPSIRAKAGHDRLVVAEGRSPWSSMNSSAIAPMKSRIRGRLKVPRELDPAPHGGLRSV